MLNASFCEEPEQLSKEEVCGIDAEAKFRANAQRGLRNGLPFLEILDTSLDLFAQKLLKVFFENEFALLLLIRQTSEP